MQALWYLSKTSFRNKYKKAMKKPVTYIYLALGIAYLAMLIFGWVMLVSAGGVDSVSGLVYIITIWTYLEFTTNFITYAKRKGVIFKPSHTHLIFTAPVNPKQVLLHGSMKNFIISMLIDLAIAAAGVTIFHLPLWKGILLFLFTFILKSVLEGSLIVFLYSGEERFRKLVKVLCWCIYAVIASIVLIVLFFLKKNGLSLQSVTEVFHLPALQMIPIAGWGVAAMRLVILGPDVVNIVCTILYVLSCAGMLWAAYRMKCSGEYYEDAAKFADDYVRMKAMSKKGEVVFSVGKKKKFRKASMNFFGKGAKAILYRQILEYKKERFFIFGTMTIYCLIGMAVCIFFIGAPESFPPGITLLGVAAYLVFLSSGYLGKWGKELNQPYLYLIPDTPIRKLWYATIMEHVKALADSLLFAIPVGIVWKVPAYQVAAVVLIYTVLQSNRLYIKVLGESILGNTLGNTGKSIFAMAVQCGVLGIGIGFAALMGIFINYNLVFLIIPIYSMMITVLLMWLTSARFENMEQWDD